MSDLSFYFQSFFAFVYGTMIGSFFCVCYSRWPEIKNLSFKNKIKGLSFPLSHCPLCQYKIKWYENIPIFSYIFLNGKCSNCKKRIPINYVLFEIVAGMIGYIVFLIFTMIS